MLASFALLERLEDAQTDEEAEETIRWLVDRQGELPPIEVSSSSQLDSSNTHPPKTAVAGFQGRIGKPLDACYSFWCTAGLTIMAKRRGKRNGNGPTPVLYDPRANIEFILRCQSAQWGGIGRSPGDHPGERVGM